MALLTPSPTLPTAAPVSSDRQRLIDSGMLHYEASRGGFTERYRRGETPHTIHVWWARRPHSAMRALIFATLAKETNTATIAVMDQLGRSALPDKKIVARARAIISKQYESAPKVLDMFGGGGTIPFEASVLGAESHAIDVNGLAIFIQRALLHDATRVDNRQLKEMVLASGQRVLARLEKRTDELFPHRGRSCKPIGYFWTYEYPCPHCHNPISLLKRPWVSKKKERQLAFTMAKGHTPAGKIIIKKVAKNFKFQSAWDGRRPRLVCPTCEVLITGISIKDCKDIVIGRCLPQPKTGKDFDTDIDGAVLDHKLMVDREWQLLQDLDCELPLTKIPQWSGIVNPALYGFVHHSDSFNLRQRLVLLTLIAELRAEFNFLQQSEGTESATLVIALLSGLIDQLVDWNCRLSMWISQNEQVGRAFCGPGIAMMWEYFEMDPLQKGPANLHKKLERIVAGIGALQFLDRPVNVVNACAQRMPFAANTFDAVITDPPYYDNIYYSVLSDFFYVWKKLLFAKINLLLFDSDETNKTEELVASAQRSGDAVTAFFEYTQQLSLALAEAERVLKPHGVLSFVYSHSSVDGWCSLIAAFRSTKLQISSVQPLSIERKARPRAIKSAAVNTCVVFVARKVAAKKKVMGRLTMASFVKQAIAKEFARSLLNSGWAPDDVGVALLAQAVGLLTNGLSDGTWTDQEMISVAQREIAQLLPQFTVQNRSSI